MSDAVVIRSVPISRGFAWFRQGWRGFANAPGLLIGVLFLWLIVALGLQFIPFIGALASIVISPALFGGYLLMCRSAIANEEPGLEQFFSGLTRAESRMQSIVLGSLLLLGYAGVFVITGLFFVFMALAVLGTIPWQILNELQTAGSPEDVVVTMGMLLVFMLTALVMSLLYTLLAVAFTYASPLVVEIRTSSISALQLSVGACLRNILPLSVFGLVFIILFILALIPLGLGLLVFLPVSMAAIAASYEDLFA